MIYHVLPGDAYIDTFRKSGIGGEIVVCRECLVEGDLGGETLEDLWSTRENYLSSAYPDNENNYRHNVATELEKITRVGDGDEINLWFENELFCSANMWFCLDLLKDTRAAVYRVKAVDPDSEDPWEGFGNLGPDEFRDRFVSRERFSKAEMELGSDLWQAFRLRDNEQLQALGKAESRCFPELDEVCRAARELETMPADILNEIKGEGHDEFAEIFLEFKKRGGVYGFGDSQVRRILQQ